MKLYLLVSGLSRFVRHCLMGNPFEVFSGNVWVEIFGLEVLPALVAYKTVGLFYDSGSFPVLGAIAFFFTYLIYCQLITTLGNIGVPLLVVIILLSIILLAVCSLKKGLRY